MPLPPVRRTCAFFDFCAGVPQAKVGLSLAIPDLKPMARIRSIKRFATVTVTVAGRLRAADIGRLEHACGPALTFERAQLVVDLQGVTEIDNVAEAHLRHMAGRGAVIKKAN